MRKWNHGARGAAASNTVRMTPTAIRSWVDEPLGPEISPSKGDAYGGGDVMHKILGETTVGAGMMPKAAESMRRRGGIELPKNRRTKRQLRRECRSSLHNL